MRRDAWTTEHDEVLTQTVIENVRIGKTQLTAFREAALKLDRTASACGFRWNGVLRNKESVMKELNKAKGESRERYDYIVGRRQYRDNQFDLPILKNYVGFNFEYLREKRRIFLEYTKNGNRFIGVVSIELATTNLLSFTKLDGSNSSDQITMKELESGTVVINDAKVILD